MEGLTGAAAGAGNAVIAAKVQKRLPGNIPMHVGYKAGLIAVGLWGQHLGLGADVRDPAFMAGLALAGDFAARAAMQNKLSPSQWAAVGGEGGDGSGFSFGGDGQGGQAKVLPGVRNMAPSIRRIGRGGFGLDLYPGVADQGGVAY